jgi:hypothetical protein
MADVTMLTVAPEPAGAWWRLSDMHRAVAMFSMEPTMTASSKFRQAALVLAFATSLSVAATSQSFAYSEEARQMCTGDAFRLCSSEIPNIPAITACMYKHRAQLSAGCRAVMDKDLAANKGKVADSE